MWAGNASGQGNPDLKSVSTSAPVLFDIFSTLPQTTWPEQPEEEMVLQQVCSHSGYAASNNCPETKFIFRSKNAAAPQLCPYCTTVSFTPDGVYRATAEDLTGEKAGNYDGTVPKIEKRFVLPPHLEYWYKNTNLAYEPLPDFVPWHTSSTKDSFSIVFPQSGSNYIIPVELDGSPGAMVMQAATRSVETILYWDLDGQYLGLTERVHEMTIAPEAGKHTLTVTANNGTMRKKYFEILEQ